MSTAARFLFGLLLIGFLTQSVFAQPQTPTPEMQIETLKKEIEQLEKEMMAIKSQITANDFSQEREKSRQLLKEINEALGDVNEKNFFFSQQILTLFGTVIGIASLAVALVSWFSYNLLKEDLERRVSEKAVTAAQERVDAFVGDVSNLTSIRSYITNSFVWWRYANTEIIQSFVKNSASKEVINSIEASLRFIQNADDIILTISPYFERRNAYISYKIEIDNHKIFLRTLDLELRRMSGDPIPEGEILDVLSNAQALKIRANQDDLKNKWYALENTAAFALLKLGGDELKNSGRETILSLIQGATDGSGRPKPRKAWREFAYDFYFPIDITTGSRADPHGIGLIPEAPS